MKKIIILIILNFVGVVSFFIPLAAFVYCLSRHKWVVSLLCLTVFGLVKYVFSKIEERVGIYSLTSRMGRERGAGITIIAPWVKRRYMDESENDTFPIEKKGR